MSQERIDLSKIWIALDQLHFIPYWAKKLGELWSTNQKVIDAHVNPPNWNFFRETIIRPSGDAGPSNFYTPYNSLNTLQLPKMYFKSDMGRRAASCWALPHISSFIFFTNGWEFLINFYTPIARSYARLQIFIQLSPILTKLCHIKRYYPVHIICAKCPKRPKTRAFWRGLDIFRILRELGSSA